MMSELDEIKMVEDAFDYVIIKVMDLIKNYNNLYNEIHTGNANLIAAWEGDAANAFKEKSAVVEKNISQNIESIQNDLLQGLRQTEKEFIDLDHKLSASYSNSIIAVNNNK